MSLPLTYTRQLARLRQLVLLVLWPALAHAQLVLPSATTAKTENFDGMGTATAAGTAATLPTGFKLSADAAPSYTSANNTTATTQSTTYMSSFTTGGSYNFGSGGTTVATATDRALGFLSSSSIALPRHILLAIKNTSGATIQDLTITFDLEQYRKNTQVVDWKFFTSTDGTAWNSQSDGDQNFAAATSAYFYPPSSVNKTVTLTGLNLADQGTYYLRWTMQSSNGNTNGQGIGLDNLVLTPTTGTGTPPTPPAATITTTAATYGSPWCVTATAGSPSFNVAYTTTGTFTGTFKAQLSDATGTFPADVTSNLIGSGASPIVATIPAGTASGTSYRIRVVNTAPSTFGTDNGSPLTISLPPATNSVAVAPAADQTLTPTGRGTTLTATPTAASAIAWFYGTAAAGPFPTAIAGATSATYQPKGADFAGLGDYYVVAQAISTCGSVLGTSTPVKITVATAPPILTTSVPTLPDFGSVAVGSSSSAKSFTVVGSSLSGSITITPPAGFEIRTGATAFACCAITLTPVRDTVATTQIDVRFAPLLAQAYSGQLTVASPGFASQTVAVTGMGTVATYPATVSTTAPSAITTTSAAAGGTVSADGGSPVTAYGVAFGIDPEPTVAGPHTTDGSNLATFTSALAGLHPGVLYYVRAYATNGQGTIYGEQYTFTTVAVPLAAEPTVPSQLTVSNLTSTRLLLTATGGNGAKHLILAHFNGNVNQDPVDATTYSASSTFGQGTALGPDADNFVVYAATGDTVTVLGLRPNTPYSFAVYDYNDNNTPYAENYLTTASDTLSLTTPPLPPTLLLEENFAYTAGQSLTANGWTSHSGGTTNEIKVTSPSLTYPGYASRAGNAALLSGSGQDINRAFPFVYPRTTVYLSCLVSVSNATAAGDYFLHLANGPLSTSYYRGRIFVRKATDNSIQFGVSGSGAAATAAFTTTSYALNTTYLLLLRYSFDETGSQADLFLNPDLSGRTNYRVLATADASYTETGSSAAPPNIGTVALRQSVASMVMTVDGINVATAFPLATVTPLPVTLTDFTAKLVGPAVQLNWHTASEQNADRFEVERSTDATTFTPLGSVAAAGTSSQAHAYAFPDTHLPVGATTLYYRLRQVDLDGTSTYSPVRTVALTPAAAGLALFPNPTQQLTTLTGTAAHALVQVFDALGRTVTTATADGDGTAQLALPTGLAPGVYVVRTGTQALRLLIE